MITIVVTATSFTAHQHQGRHGTQHPYHRCHCHCNHHYRGHHRRHHHTAIVIINAIINTNIASATPHPPPPPKKKKKKKTNKQPRKQQHHCSQPRYIQDFQHEACRQFSPLRPFSVSVPVRSVCNAGSGRPPQSSTFTPSENACVPQSGERCRWQGEKRKRGPG